MRISTEWLIKAGACGPGLRAFSLYLKRSRSPEALDVLDAIMAEESPDWALWLLCRALRGERVVDLGMELLDAAAAREARSDLRQMWLVVKKRRAQRDVIERAQRRLRPSKDDVLGTAGMLVMEAAQVWMDRRRRKATHAVMMMTYMDEDRKKAAVGIGRAMWKEQLDAIGE